MGLDMYLKGKRFLWHNEHDEIADEPVIKKLTKGRQLKQIEFELGYWRKANAIHKWFVDNCQGGEDDCDEYLVKYSDLVKLKDICKEVLDNKKPELLPTTSGFFFGSTEYDEWYWNSIQDTYELMSELCQDEDITNGSIDVYYQSSW
jgi:hypothetical protein